MEKHLSKNFEKPPYDTHIFRELNKKYSQIKQEFLASITPENIEKQAAIFEMHAHQLLSDLSNDPNNKEADDAAAKFDYEIDRNWSQEEISHILDTYGKFLEGQKDLHQTFLPRFLGTKNKTGEDIRTTVSDLVINYLAEKVSSNICIPDVLQNSLSIWAQNIHMAKPELVNKLFLSSRNNPGILNRHLLSEMQMSIAFYGQHTIDNVAKSALDENTSFLSASSAIDTLQTIYQARYQTGYEDSGEYAREVLEKILEKRTEYFLQARITAILDDDFRIKNWGGYKDNIELNSKYNVPLEGISEWEKENFIFYAKLSNNYGAVYSAHGEVVTVFKLDENKRETGDGQSQEIIVPETTTIKNILLESGVDEKLCTEEYISNYRALIEPRMQSFIEEEFRIKLSDYNVRAQVAFLNLLSRSSSYMTKYIKEIIEYGATEKERTMIMNTFLLAEDEKPDLALEHISALLEKKDIGMPIIEKFNELIGSVYEAERAIKEMYPDATGRAFSNEVAKMISAKAKPLLTKFYSHFWEQGNLDELAHGEDIMRNALGDDIDSLSGIGQLKEARDRAEQNLREKIMTEISNIEKDALLKFSAFAVLKKEGLSIDWKDIVGVQYEVGSAEKFKNDTELISRMESIYRGNYKNYPPEFVNIIVSSFKESFENPETQLFVLKYHDRPVAFCRMDKTLDQNGDVESFNFASFNVDPTYKQSRLGEAMFEAAMTEVGRLGAPIFADCDPQAPITQKYIKSGFVATEIYALEGVPVFKIEYNTELLKDLQSVNLSKDKILEISENNEADNFIVKKWATGEKPGFELLNQGYLLTRYFAEGDRAYAVFEKDPRAIKKDSKEQKAA